MLQEEFPHRRHGHGGFRGQGRQGQELAGGGQIPHQQHEGEHPVDGLRRLGEVGGPDASGHGPGQMAGLVSRRNMQGPLIGAATGAQLTADNGREHGLEGRHADGRPEVLDDFHHGSARDGVGQMPGSTARGERQMIRLPPALPVFQGTRMQTQPRRGLRARPTQLGGPALEGHGGLPHLALLLPAGLLLVSQGHGGGGRFTLHGFSDLFDYLRMAFTAPQDRRAHGLAGG